MVILGVYSVYSKMIRFFNETNYDKGLKYETLTAEMRLQSSEIKLTTYLSQYSQYATWSPWESPKKFSGTHPSSVGVFGSPRPRWRAADRDKFSATWASLMGMLELDVGEKLCVNGFSWGSTYKNGW